MFLGFLEPRSVTVFSSGLCGKFLKKKVTVLGFTCCSHDKLSHAKMLLCFPSVSKIYINSMFLKLSYLLEICKPDLLHLSN